MATLTDFLNSCINKTLEELCEELLELKKSYFSPKGKPGARWKPLTQNTLRVKKSRNPATYNSFNTGTGKLRNSLDVVFERTSTGARITALANDDAVLVNYLTKSLGRDFLDFGDLEKEYIMTRFMKILQQNVAKG